MIYPQGVCKKKKKYAQTQLNIHRMALRCRILRSFEQIRTVNNPRLYFTVIFFLTSCMFENSNPKKEPLLSQLTARTENCKFETQASVLNIKTERKLDPSHPFRCRGHLSAISVASCLWCFLLFPHRLFQILHLQKVF